jgi:hypothetical protein
LPPARERTDLEPQCQTQLVSYASYHLPRSKLAAHRTNTRPPSPQPQTESSSMPSTQSKRSPRPGPPGRRLRTACASTDSTNKPWRATLTA